VASHLELAKA